MQIDTAQLWLPHLPQQLRSFSLSHWPTPCLWPPPCLVTAAYYTPYHIMLLSRYRLYRSIARAASPNGSFFLLWSLSLLAFPQTFLLSSPLPQGSLSFPPLPARCLYSSDSVWNLDFPFSSVPMLGAAVSPLLFALTHASFSPLAPPRFPRLYTPVLTVSCASISLTSPLTPTRLPLGGPKMAPAASLRRLT